MLLFGFGLNLIRILDDDMHFRHHWTRIAVDILVILGFLGSLTGLMWPRPPTQESKRRAIERYHKLRSFDAAGKPRSGV